MTVLMQNSAENGETMCRFGLQHRQNCVNFWSSRPYFYRKILLLCTVFPIKSARKGLRDIIKSEKNNIMRVILLMLRDNGGGGLKFFSAPSAPGGHIPKMDPSPWGGGAP